MLGALLSACLTPSGGCCCTRLAAIACWPVSVTGWSWVNQAVACMARTRVRNTAHQNQTKHGSVDEQSGGIGATCWLGRHTHRTATEVPMTAFKLLTCAIDSARGGITSCADCSLLPHSCLQTHAAAMCAAQASTTGISHSSVKALR